MTDKVKPREEIRDLLGLPKVVPYTHNKVVPVTNPCPSLLYGVELEIENADAIEAVDGMRATEDGSLRNNGMEFITLPMTYSVKEFVLRRFFANNTINEHNYSERCSIHVHTNVQNLTVEEVASVCLIYQVFERLLFNWIGHERDKNIFCVPWYDTTLNYRVISRLMGKDLQVFGNWAKYTALNLLPVREHGTIEWRHMHGHSDLNRIMTWLRIIGCIYRLAVSLPLKDIQQMFIGLNTTSMYTGAITQVFNELADELRVPGYEEAIENGVISMKYSLLSPTKVLPQPKVAPPTAPGGRTLGDVGAAAEQARIMAGMDLSELDRAAQLLHIRQEQRVNNENIWGAWIDAVQQERQRQEFVAERVVVRNNVITDDLSEDLR